MPQDTAAPSAPASDGRPGGESTITVLVALGANLAVAVAKGVAAVITGSASMAAETAHSFADTLNQVFLLIALKGSTRPADRAHPFGYGRVRYFWALLAAGSIFVTGALYSAYEGVHALTSGEHDVESPLINYVVLGVAFVLEGVSLLRGLQQTRGEARQHRLGFRDFLRTSDDPTATTVVFEDSAALIGLVLAAAGNVLHQVTGHAYWDGVASLAIAVLLAAVALRLGLANKRLLTDVQADPRLVRAVLVHLGDEPEVEAVVDLLTLTLGTDSVLVCARLDLDDDLGAADVERATVRIGDGVREAFPDVAEVFLEPVPRHDQGVRERVRSRYGDRLAEYMVHEASGS
ncbi:cation transporter [Streptomyces sp. NP160]|uniref:cation diffusion facilitator family transporter n=1 Tax=Streptomyces sp. NP160 TaxID=2586637 RepID=UPI0011196721|nr:cation transporter [Streptomyces sp. NP160]TNM68323.1 cation transporter [Streptomyces sp. NP160]